MTDFLPQALADIQLAEWPIHVVDHVSASQIKQFLRCPEQYRRRRIRDDKEPPAGALIWGTAHHAALEVNYEQKIESHEDAPVDVLQDVFATRLDEQVDEAGGAYEVNWGNSKEWRAKDPPDAYAEVKDRGVAMVAAHRAQVMPHVQPTAVEQEFSVTIPGLPVPIVGYIDVEAQVADPIALLEATVTGNMPKGEPHIIDQKTAGRAGLSNENRVQGWTYQLHKPLPVDFHVALKLKTPRVVTPANDAQYHLPVAPHERTFRMVQMVMRSIATMYATYGPDEPWPGAFGGFADVCGYCGFKPVEGSELTASGKPGCPWWTTARWRDDAPVVPLFD